MKLSVMIVDDSPAMRSFVRRVLDMSGLEIEHCLQASNGQEALDLLKTKTVSLVLSDINMPKMDGLQMLAALKSSPERRHIPVVMITTEGGETKVGEAVKLGAAGYVRKPFTADQIKDKLAGILALAAQL